MRGPPRSLVALTLGVAAFLATARYAHAYRPFDGTDAAVAEGGEVELELGPVGLLDTGSDRALIVPAGIVNLGVYLNTELVLEGKQHYRLTEQMVDAAGAGAGGRWAVTDTAFSVKHVFRQGFLQGGQGTSIAGEASMLLPTYNDQAGLGAAATVIASHQAGPLALHLNVEGLLSRLHQRGAFAGLIVEGPFTWRARPVAELFVEGERHGGHAFSALVGTIWAFREALSFDAGVRLTRLVEGAHGVDALEVRLGLTWAFRVFSASS